MIPFDKLSHTNRRSLEDIGSFIFVSDPPEPADIILVPGSQERALGEHAARLWHQGYAPMICVTGKYSERVSSFAAQLNDPELIPDAERYATEASFLKAVIISNKVDESAIIMEENSRNTFENAIYSSQILKKLGCHKIMLCCQAFHARRALMTFSYIMPEMEIFVCPVETKNTGKDNWTDSEQAYRRVMSELRKCGTYFCRDE